MRSVEERFWTKVDRTGECWLWGGSKNKDGYGRFWFEGRLVTAHCFVYEWEVGPIPEGMQVDHHTCHNPSCVRPQHLRLATPKQNQENKAGAYANSKTGIRGVSWYPKLSKWVARVKHHNKVIHIGYFEDIKDAETAAIARRNELFTHNTEDRKF